MSAEGVQDEDIGDRPASPNESGHRKLLGRIADALQVPKAALYQPLKAVEPAWGTPDEGTTDLAQECAALLHAYQRIGNPKERRRLLALVQEVAERLYLP